MTKTVIKIVALEIKSLKTFMGMDMPGYECMLYVNGVKSARFFEEGSGGEPVIEWTTFSQAKKSMVPMNKKFNAEEAMYIYVKSLGKCKSPFEGDNNEYDYHVSSVVAELVDREETRRRIKRQLSKKIVLHRSGLKSGEYVSINYKGKGKLPPLWVEIAKTNLPEKYKSETVTIANDDLEAFLTAIGCEVHPREQ